MRTYYDFLAVSHQADKVLSQSVSGRWIPLIKFEGQGLKCYLGSEYMLCVTVHLGHSLGMASTGNREGVHFDLLEAHGVLFDHIVGSKDAAHNVLSPAALLGVLEDFPKTSHKLVMLEQWSQDAFQPLVIV